METCVTANSHDFPDQLDRIDVYFFSKLSLSSTSEWCRVNNFIEMIKIWDDNGSANFHMWYTFFYIITYSGQWTLKRDTTFRLSPRPRVYTPYPSLIRVFLNFYLSIYLKLVKHDIEYQYTVKNSFPYKNKMLIEANGAIKSIIKKNVKIKKLNFRTKIMNKTNF